MQSKLIGKRTARLSKVEDKIDSKSPKRKRVSDIYIADPIQVEKVTASQILKPKYNVKFNCNCTTTKCLKKYCKCFDNLGYCHSACKCKSCRNKPKFSKEIEATREKITLRNPNAFKPRVAQGKDDRNEASSGGKSNAPLSGSVR